MRSHRLLRNTWKACATHSPDYSQPFCVPTRRQSYKEERSHTCSLRAHKAEVPLPRINRRLSVRRMELVPLLPIDRTLCCVDVSFPPHRIYPAWWVFQLSAPHSRCFSWIKNTEAELIQSDVNCTYDNNRTICNLLHIGGSYMSFFFVWVTWRQARFIAIKENIGNNKALAERKDFFFCFYKFDMYAAETHPTMDRLDTMDVSNWSKKQS